MARICVKANVTGIVQGVGFRYHTAHQGLKLSLSGFARNESDGSVTVMICGEESQVNQLIIWLEEGPPTAQVDSLHVEQQDWQFFNGFSIQ